jgi:hypothetical protein
VHTVADEKLPTRIQALAFGFKAACFRARRRLKEFGCGPRRHPLLSVDGAAEVVAESRSLLYPSQSGAEFGLQAGKVQNLRVAASYLNGMRMLGGEEFSFWAQVPRPTRSRGFVAGRELREGCIIPSVGGGLCQLSNALYDAALKAGFEIIERHGHSRVLPGSMAEHGRDATIFWNYVDLRFRPLGAVQLEVVLGRGELVVRFRRFGDEGVVQQIGVRSDPGAHGKSAPAGDAVESCESCGITRCFRHPEAAGLPRASLTAWIVDAFWPEYDAYLRRERGEGDWLFTPLARGNYRWSSAGFAKVNQAPLVVLRRSVVSRRLAAQGAERQRALLEMDEQLAMTFARRIPSSAAHLVVSQNLLPFLFRSGVLGGRTFDVLMTRLPLADLQETLDRAARCWPDSRTLADFRAAPDLLDAERRALAEARHWITPHSEIARIGGGRSIKLDWQLPNPAGANRAGGQRLLFPASTLGRKGAWEMRELRAPLKLAGPVLEAPDFWASAEVEHCGFDLDGVGAVVLPAWVENQPRRLLQAVSAGVPVIASEACGLGGVDGVTVVETGNLEALREALSRVLTPDSPAIPASRPT